MGTQRKIKDEIQGKLKKRWGEGDVSGIDPFIKLKNKKGGRKRGEGRSVKTAEKDCDRVGC